MMHVYTYARATFYRLHMSTLLALGGGVHTLNLLEFDPPPHQHSPNGMVDSATAGH